MRPIRPEDEPQHRAFVERLSPADLRLRFFYSRRELPRSEIARLTQIDYAREMAFIAVRKRADGGEETLGVVRAVCDPDNVEAEFAIVVRSDLHCHGLGHLLLARMLEYLAEHGTQRVVAYVLRDNGAMRDLALHAGFVVEARASDPDTVTLVKTLRAPSAPASEDSAASR